jgi:hypothetical protein
VADLESVFDDATRAKAQAAVFITDNLLFGHRKEIADIALAHHLPTIHAFPAEVQDGGLMSLIRATRKTSGARRRWSTGSSRVRAPPTCRSSSQPSSNWSSTSKPPGRSALQSPRHFCCVPTR